MAGDKFESIPYPFYDPVTKKWLSGAIEGVPLQELEKKIQKKREKEEEKRREAEELRKAQEKAAEERRKERFKKRLEHKEYDRWKYKTTVIRQPREYFRFVERILRNFPAMIQELEMWEDLIESTSYRGGWLTELGISDKNRASVVELSMQIKEETPLYQILLKRVNIIKKALDTLSDVDHEFISVIYFKGMTVEEAAPIFNTAKVTLWERIRRILSSIMPFFIADWWSPELED